MKPFVVLTHSDSPSSPGIKAACAAVLLTSLLLLAACGSATPEPVPAVTAPTGTEPAPGISPIPTETEPPVAGQPPFEVFIPTSAQIKTMLEAADAVQEAPAHVPPSPWRVEVLDASYQRLREEGAIVNSASTDIFNRGEATTQAVPDANIGAQFQLVSLNSPENERLQPGDDWQGKAFVAGGLLAYQDQEMLVDVKGDLARESYELMPLPAGNYLVLLYQDEAGFKFELQDESKAVPIGGYGQLRELEKAASEQPRGYLTEQQICFGQVTYQACLNVRAPAIGTGPNRELINKAVDELRLAGLMPLETTVNVDGALADVVGSQVIQRCAADLAETVEGIPQKCQPSIVVAAVESLPEDRFKLIEATSLKPPGLASMLQATPLQTSVSITETAVPVAVMNVLETLEGDVFDWDGNPMDLNPNFYRVDLLYIPLESRWLSQFVWSENGLTRYAYAEAEEVTVQGVPVTGGDPETTCDVVLSSFIVRACRKSGTEAACWNPFCSSGCHKKPYCLNKRRWC